LSEDITKLLNKELIYLVALNIFLMTFLVKLINQYRDVEVDLIAGEIYDYRVILLPILRILIEPKLLF